MTHEENTAAEIERTKSASTVTSDNDGSAPTSVSFGGENLHLARADVRQSESEKLPSAVGATTEAIVEVAGFPSGKEVAGFPSGKEVAGFPSGKEVIAVAEAPAPTGKTPDATKRQANNLRKLRIERMMSKAELARRANLSVLTIDRIEKGFGCRMDSKRKILGALGLSLGDRVRVFGEEE